MLGDPTISEDNYSEENYFYFLNEAQDLLQSLEQDLLSLREDRTPAKVHSLMRAAHTLKGAAASVDMEMMKNIAHMLEDVFKSLYNPQVVIDAELESLLFQGYECLRLCLQEPTMPASDEMARATTVIAELQTKLGDFLNQETSIPSSVELGFDVVQSIFEMGVKQRLDELALALTNPDPAKIAAILETHAEIFLGLAESLNLPGWGAIANAILAALAAHPEQAIQIASVALADFQQGHSAVLAGDRTQGGTPSLALQALAGNNHPTDSPPPSLDSLFDDFQPTPPLTVSPDLYEYEPENDSNLEPQTTLTASIQLNAPPSPYKAQSPKTAFQHVRVNVEQLEHLNYLAGELVVNQNKQSAEVEQLRKMVRELLEKSQRHHQTMSQLQDWTDRIGKSQELAYLPISPVQFDPLEMDRYSELDVLLQTALEETAQFDTITEAIDLTAKKSSLTLEKQQRLLKNVRDDLTEARMQPLGELLNRFPPVLQQLSSAQNKPVELSLTGTEVLVDKAITEKLYDPLLHLVRNAFDHGIEPPEVRQAGGKTAVGHIELRAYHQGNRTIIEVRDDGQGLNFQRICQRAVDLNLLTAEQASSVSEAQLLDLLFEPGFSTASKLSDLSGRGVGLDVVLSQLQLLKGSVIVKSQPQQGTSFLLQIPLSLTITKLMLCQANGITYALATEAVEQILLPQPDEIRWLSGQRILHRRSGQTQYTIPIHRLSNLVAYSERVSELSLFSAESTAPSEATTFKAQQSPILLLRHGTEVYGLEVDQIVGEQELVIRPLGNAIAPPKYVYGASILSNSRMALVIDVSILVNQFLVSSKPRQMREQYALPAKRIPKVLVVDDSVTIRQALTATLQKAGYQVLQATDGLEALAQLQRHTGTQLAVISDVEMPRMNGFEFLSQSRQHPALCQIPVVMLTSRSSAKYRQIAFELGAAAYLTKPYCEQELLTTLAGLLHQTVQDLVLS